MQIVVVGLNHKTSPIEVRERLSFTDEACVSGLRELIDRETVQESLIISTCNRVEVLAATDDASDIEATVNRLKLFLSATRQVPSNIIDKHAYFHAGEDAVRHMFRVASSLDSMVVGEPQILGQVRRSYAIAHREGTAGRVLNRLVHTAFRVAKRVRTETSIAASPVSIASIAVKLARQTFDSLTNRTVLLIGAGEMAELALRHLLKAGAERILITNRTDAKARELAASIGGVSVPFAQLHERLAEADIVISSTAAYDYVITPPMAERAMKRDARAAFYIDISVPRNIDPATSEIENLHVFDLDDLHGVADSNQRKRADEAGRGEEIVRAEVAEFMDGLRRLDFAPTIGAMRHKLEQIADDEYRRRRAQLGELTHEQERAIHALLISTINKISHPLIHRMRRSYDTGEASNVQVWREIFGLNDDNNADDNDGDNDK